MSRFFSERFSSLVPYTPGEQPKTRRYIKLNTNESPFLPSKKAVDAAFEASKGLNLYSDPACTALRQAFASRYRISPEEVICTNGSDEALNFAFMAFCDASRPAVFPDVTYGFYPVFARLHGVPFEEIPLSDDFTVDVSGYENIKKTVFLPNPNAPTGIALSLSEVERIVSSNPESVVVIDEAYVDFGAKSAVILIHDYDNLLVTGTFSKSRSLAGGRLGFAVGDSALIKDLDAIRFSTNPYNVNSMTMAAGIASLAEDAYFQKNCETIEKNRAYTEEKLRDLGFFLTDSKANFVFAKHPGMGGEELCLRLRERGILVRHFSHPRIADFNRITVGTLSDMDILLKNIKEILEELR